MILSPLQFLLACVLLTLAAVGIHVADDLKRRARLRKIAAGAGMHFSASDRFNLAADVARRFPIAGAAEPKISDLLYCRRGECQVYVFRFEYTVGVTGPKLRRRVVAGFVEERDRPGSGATNLEIAEVGAVGDQYEAVLAKLRQSAAANKPSA